MGNQESMANLEKMVSLITHTIHRINKVILTEKIINFSHNVGFVPVWYLSVGDMHVAYCDEDKL